MGRRSVVGVANGNFRNGDYYQYALAVARGWNNGTLERVMNKKKMRAMYWTQRLSNAMSLLRVIDPNGWEAWYDNDSNVPAEATDREFALLVETRVRALIGHYPTLKARACRGIFIWTDEFNTVYVYSKEVAKRPLYALEFTNFAQAEAFVRGLPIDNCGYGVVLDILPVDALANVEQVKG